MADPIRVAQVMGKMLGGGVEAVVMNYYRHVDRSRVQFDFVVDADSTLVPAGEIEALGGRVVEVPPYQRQPENSRALEELFRREGYPIVHSHLNTLSVFPLRAAMRAGVPVRIAHSHSTWGRGEWKKNALKAVLRTQANRYPTHRLACSRYAGEWLFGKDADFGIMRNAVELDRFAFDPAARADARAELGIADSTFVVGHVGRFVSVKNHGFLLEAFEGLTRSRPDSALLLVGMGEGRAAVERSVCEHGLQDKVRLLGQRDDVGRLYSAFDAFALPSLYEGLPLVVVEAQFSGLPCLLSDCITRETDLTGAVRFLPIADPTLWAHEFFAVPSSVRLAVNDADFVEYDINRAAERLTGQYEGLAAGVT